MSRMRAALNPVNVLAFLLKEERRSSLFLITAAGLALLLSNSQASDTYFDLLHYKFSLGAVSLDIRHWINEGLMALFFLMVSIEVKREFIDGELRTWQKAAFPVIAAVGGMLVPAFVFSIMNPYQPQSSGWAIPMATDIAIAIGVLALLGNRIPKALRIFLLSLAIVDDIGSIVVIGFFYNQPTNMLALLLAVVFVIVLALGRAKRAWPLIFIFVGLAMWYCLLRAGVSGTMAGVVVAFMMPLNRRRFGNNALQLAEKIEDVLIPFVAFVVVPLFVLANAGLRLGDISLEAGGAFGVFSGVMLGLLIGKPLGITLAALASHYLKIGAKPEGVRWRQIIGVSFLAGIGFTISLLIADLAYSSHADLQNAAVAGVFTASILSGVIGLLLLRANVRKI